MKSNQRLWPSAGAYLAKSTAIQPMHRLETLRRPSGSCPTPAQFAMHTITHLLEICPRVGGGTILPTPTRT